MPGIPILFRYLLREMAGPFFASLAIVVTIIGLGRLLQVTDLVISLDIGAADMVRLCAYLAPQILFFALPMAASLGVIIAFSRLSGDNEILVLKSCGVGFRPILAPVLFAALLTAGATLWTTAELAPAAAVNMQRLLVHLARNRIAAGIRPGVFVDAIRDVVIHVDRADPAGGRIEGVFLTDLRDPAAPLTISAATGEIVPDLERMRVTLRLEHGTALRLGHNGGDAVDFAEYELTVPVLPPRIAGSGAVGERGLDLAALVREMGRARGGTRRRLASEFHQRLALAAGCFLLVLAGMALGTAPGPGRKAPGVASGLVLFILYYALFSAGRSAADNGTMPTAAAVWLPEAVLAALTAALLFLTARDRSLPNPGELVAILTARMKR